MRYSKKFKRLYTTKKEDKLLYGTSALLYNLIEEMHKKDIKIIRGICGQYTIEELNLISIKLMDIYNNCIRE